jgi:N-acetylmuramoyl-L-alanine amidase
MGMDKSNSNFEVCQLENNVVVLEDDYTSRYEGFDPNNPESYIIFSLLQNSHLEQSLIFAEQVQKQMAFGPIKKNRGIKQDVFLVLWKCTMPSTLIELGFLSNPSDIKELINKESHKKMAKSIYDAFINYKNQYENHIDNSTIVTDPIQDNYRIQIMALSKLLDCNSPQFKGLECSVVKSGKLYRYTYGNFATQEEASNELIRIKRLFPEAYVIKTE